MSEDKIREEFEKWRFNIFDKPIGGTFYGHISMFEAYKAGYKSRDEEIKTLNHDCKNLIDVNNNQANIMESRDKEIKDLKGQLSQLESHMGLPDLKIKDVL